MEEVSHKKHLPWLYFIIIAAVLVLPYWGGRQTAFSHSKLPDFAPEIYIFFGQFVSILAMLFLILLIGLRNKKLLFALFCFGFSALQFLSGFCFLKTNFYDSTVIVFGQSANLANALSVGILSGLFAGFLYLVLTLIFYIFISRSSPKVWLAKARYNWVTFLCIQVLTLIVVFNLPIVHHLTS